MIITTQAHNLTTYGQPPCCYLAVALLQSYNKLGILYGWWVRWRGLIGVLEEWQIALMGATYSGNFAPSYSTLTSTEQVWWLKRRRPNTSTQPWITSSLQWPLKTGGVIGQKSMGFPYELVTDWSRSLAVWTLCYLMQYFSIPIQQGNAAFIMGPAQWLSSLALCLIIYFVTSHHHLCSRLLNHSIVTL